MEIAIAYTVTVYKYTHYTDNDNSYENNKEALRLPFKLNPDWIAHKHTNIKNMKVMAKEKIK